MEDRESLRRIRFWLGVFIVGVVLSGVTAFPLAMETRWLDAAVHASLVEPTARATGLLAWVVRVHQGVADTNARYPFMAYGTDWLAFGHFAIAIAFIGALRDPVRNLWLFTFGMIASALVVPYALIFGGIRGIPL